MINIRTQNDVLNGVIQVFDKSNLTDTFDKAFIELPSLGLSKELNSGTTPTLSSFLSPNSLTGIAFNARMDEIVDVKYTLFSALSNSGLTYILGDNIVRQSGIYNLFSQTDYIYIDRLYTIDKSRSGADFLYLTAPIKSNATTVYKAYHTRKCVAILYDIPEKIKQLAMNFDDCCDCKQGEVLCRVLQFYEAIKVQEECNDCEKLKSFLDKLKQALNIC